MNLKNEFTRLELERLRRDCGFTDAELAVFDLRTDGRERSVDGIAQALNMSTATVNRRLRDIKKKIIRVI